MFHNLLVLWGVLFGFFTVCVHSKLNDQEKNALQSMYDSLNPKPKNWKRDSDPCGWQGIKCSGSSITEIKLSGLGLSGNNWDQQLVNLKSLTTLDLSKNKFSGNAPQSLPLSLKYLDLSRNALTNNIPWGITQLSNLETLNLGHNKFNGELQPDAFNKTTKIEKMDLSFNSLTGNLSRSFEKLSKLLTLYLQNNQLTGKIDILLQTPVEDLNIENNKFIGHVPQPLQEIKIKSGGNKLDSGEAPPSPPGVRRRKRSDIDGGGGTSITKGLAIAGVAFALLFLLGLIMFFFSRKKRPNNSHLLEAEKFDRRKSFSVFSSRDLTKDMHSDYDGLKTADSAAVIDIKPPPQRSPSTGFKSISGRLQSFARRSTSVKAVSYALADLQIATTNFAPGRLLGQGTVGRVYKAKFEGGKVLAIKKIDSSLFQGTSPQEFSDIVVSISRIRHANIAELVGYCTEQGHNMLIYEYFRNGSLNEFLHMSDDYSNPLTWNTRVKIALGAAKAVEYLHETCSPPVLHKNIKSSNIFLDLELYPRLSDYGLATFHQRTSQNLGTGYNAPECTKPSAFTIKSDVYSFGVVMLELLTGRKPVDNSKPRPEQNLVRWATPQLHDAEALAKMVDPALRGLYDDKSVSKFADIVALCVQREAQYRPPISEVVQQLTRLVQRSAMDYSLSRGSSNMSYREDLQTSRRLTDF